MDSRDFPTTFPEFQKVFPDDEACAKYLEHLWWPQGFSCPKCVAIGEPYRFIGSNDATPEEELWHRIHAPERGLTPEDVMAYRKSKRGPVARFFARLKFWPTPVKSMDDYEVPAFLHNQSD